MNPVRNPMNELTGYKIQPTMTKQISNGVKTLLSTLATLLFSVSRASAHEEGIEVTNVAESDWLGPLIAIIVIFGAIILARIIRNRSNRQITNQ